jgi:hypothetical protein
MKRRNFACSECFRLRRKCEWTEGRDSCTRCVQKSLTCVARQVLLRRKPLAWLGADFAQQHYIQREEDFAVLEGPAGHVAVLPNGQVAYYGGGAGAGAGAGAFEQPMQQQQQHSAQQPGGGAADEEAAISIDSFREPDQVLDEDLDLAATYLNIEKLVRAYKALGLSSPPPALQLFIKGFFLTGRNDRSMGHVHAATALALSTGVVLDMEWISRGPPAVPRAAVQELLLELQQGQGMSILSTFVNGAREVQTTGLFAYLFESAKTVDSSWPLRDMWDKWVVSRGDSQQLMEAIVSGMLRLTDRDWVGQPPRLTWDTELREPVQIRCNQGLPYRARLHVEAVLALGGSVHLWHFYVSELQPLSQPAADRLVVFQTQRAAWVGKPGSLPDFDQLPATGLFAEKLSGGSLNSLTMISSSSSSSMRDSHSSAEEVDLDASMKSLTVRDSLLDLDVKLHAPDAPPKPPPAPTPITPPAATAAVPLKKKVSHFDPTSGLVDPGSAQMWDSFTNVVQALGGPKKIHEDEWFV